MNELHFTIVRHRNGYYEIRDKYNNFTQSADTRQEAMRDVQKLEEASSFASVLESEMSKIG